MIKKILDLIQTKQNFGQDAGKSCPESQPGILLIDDDMIFGKTMVAMARSQGIALSHFNCPNQVPWLSFLRTGVILMDFELEKMTGAQLISILERCLKLPPILLISSYSNIDKCRWPISVSSFVSKSLGPSYVLEVALRVAKDNRTDRCLLPGVD